MNEKRTYSDNKIEAFVWYFTLRDINLLHIDLYRFLEVLIYMAYTISVFHHARTDITAYTIFYPNS